MAQMIGATKHVNWHVMVETYNNITFVMKFLITEKTFIKILSHDSENNDKSIYINLF